tara:strand:+ start:259 stop:879 length:621 start_codon:yes stop_codon:yes gene_type:complete
MNINVESMFAVPIGWTFLEDIDLYELLHYGHRQLRPELSYSQSGNIDLDEEPIKSLSELVTEEVNKVYKECGFKHSQKLDSVWFNKGNPRSISKPHTHPQSFFVAILYLNNPENNSGNLTLLNPNNNHDHLIPHDAIGEYTPYTRMHTIVPFAEKLLVVHPAWIMHYVSQEDPEENRMSIAFNFSLDLPESTGYEFNTSNPLMNLT